MVDGIVTRLAPAVEDFDGFLKVLRTDLGRVTSCFYCFTSEGLKALRSPIWNRGPTRRCEAIFAGP